MLFAGLDIPVFYDSLLGKLIVWGETRDEAIARMRVALRGLIVAGPQTNIPFHLALFEDPDFQRGAFDTGWLERSFTMPGLLEGPAAAVALAAAGAVAHGVSQTSTVRPRTRWVASARGLTRRGLVNEEGASGWRRGTTSR